MKTESDARFEAEALAAWEECQLTGTSVSGKELDGLFAEALAIAGKPAKRRARRRRASSRARSRSRRSPASIR